jgi:hypothetical protein
MSLSIWLWKWYLTYKQGGLLNKTLSLYGAMVQQKDAHKKQIFAYIIFNLNNSTSLINSLSKDLSIEDTICTFQDKI